MPLKSIEIKNVKGIKSRCFELNILPNKPSILVAPNGFGKSSLATAFNSLQTNRINIHDDNLHEGKDTNRPSLTVTLQQENNSTLSLHADDNTNTLHGTIDWFVINNLVKAKAVKKNYGGHTSASASLAIEPIILIDKIPDKTEFDYSISDHRLAFGTNGKVLPNISSLFENLTFADHISDEIGLLDKIQGARVQTAISNFVTAVNQQTGTKEELLGWISTNKLSELSSITHLNELRLLIGEFDSSLTCEADHFLAAIQVANLFVADKSRFRNACKHKNYELDKYNYKALLGSFNTSKWKTVSPKESKGKLLVSFPKAHQLSNGQRDVLSFIVLLQKAKRKLRKSYSILVIDEVFDYLDDANLIAVQYYITQLIKEYKDNGKKLYALILTHLNPRYFKNYAFSDQKTYYLDKRDIQVSHALKALLRNRNKPQIETTVSKLLLHFHTDSPNQRADFKTLGLRETWGELDHFDKFIAGEISKYLKEQDDYDPFAVCCAVRKNIEKKVFELIGDPSNQSEFLETKKTRCKLDFASSLGIEIPEIYYLLGIIYNDGMHWRENQDNVSPVATKLENLTIRNLITDTYK